MRHLSGLAFAAAFFAALPAGAQDAPSSSPSSGPSAHGKRAGSSGHAPVFFYADEMQRDQDQTLTVARGHVQITQGNLSVLADTVTYNEATDTITATGHVTITQPSGDVAFGSYVQLSDNLQNGFLEDVRILFIDRSRAAGNTGRRTGGNRMELRRAVYSPCDLCAEDPDAAPLWQIKAEKIVHDEDTHLIEYHDATLEMDGIPVVYTPYISIPDPTIKRASGFLPPNAGSSRNLGNHFKIPYYWALAEDKDLVVTPIFTSREGSAVSGEYRQRFVDGSLDLRGSINDGKAPTGSGTATGTSPAIRGHIFGSGEFDLSDTWRTGFDLARTTDQTYMQLFSLGGTPSFLVNRAFAEGFYPRSFASVNAYAFQPMRQGFSDSSQPIVLPVADFNWITPTDEWGGHWDLDANFLNISYLTGAGSHRLSLGGTWSKEATGPLGDIYTVYAGARGDSYYANDLARLPNSAQNGSSFNGRLFPQAAVEWRYPWVRRGAEFEEMIEPIAMVVAAPVGGNSLQLPNQDSLTFEYSDADLFVPDRFKGYDRVDGGDRVDYGVKTSIYGVHGGHSEFLVGQSYRMQTDSSFPKNSGLEARRSDVVGRMIVSPSDDFDLFYRFRLDRNDLRAQRQEAGVTGGGEQLRITASIVDLPPDPLPVNPSDNTRRDQLALSGAFGLTRYWSVNLATVRNLTSDLGTLSSRAILTYHDECFALMTTLAQSGITNRDIRPGASILFTFVFKNFGAVNAPTIASALGGLP